MSIINQALKKAQRQRGETYDRQWWVRAGPPETALRKRRRPVAWVLAAMLVALVSGAAVHTWLGGAPARLRTVLEPAQPVANAAPPLQPAPSITAPTRSADAGSRALPPGPRARPAPSDAAAVDPVPSVGLGAARPPTLVPGNYVSRGNDLYRQGEYRGAADMYQAALALRPGDLKARNNLGIAYMQLDMDDRAIAAFQEVLRLDGAYGLAYYNLACLHARAGDAVEAAHFLERAVEIEPRARDWARTDGDFSRVRETPLFRRQMEP